MAINLASKYSDKVAERFKQGSLTDSGAGHAYDFVGVKSVTVYSIDTVETAEYTRSGTSRYGSLTELGDTKQEMTMTQDRAFTFSIDAGNAAEQFNIKQANACLKRELDEVVTPEIDKYRLEKWANGNGLPTGFAVLTANDGALTKANVIEKIFTASATMSDNKVPRNGRTLYLPELEFVKFKLADVVMAADGVAAENIRRGYRGTIDGMDVVTVPSSLMPAGVNFMIKHKDATVDPFKLKNYRVQKNPMGVDGDVVEGRYLYDAFVLAAKCKGIYVSKSATSA